jgi:hypothetical protein
MRFRPSRSAVFLSLACLATSVRAVAEDSPINLADLEAYRAALSAKPGDPGPTVGFRELWDRPEAHVGRTVSVEGRVARLFRQPKVGEFPPLVEAWVVSPSGDPFCLVFPQAGRHATPDLGASVRFSGTFLKRIKYQGGDSARLAPLIVGPEAPSTSPARTEVEGPGWSTPDWMMAVGAFLVVGLILARRHLFRPALPPRRDEPPPSFLDGDPSFDGDCVEEEEGNSDETRR